MLLLSTPQIRMRAPFSRLHPPTTYTNGSGQVVFEYDASGTRTKKTSGDKQTRYVSSLFNYVQDDSTGDHQIKYYIMAGSKPVAVKTRVFRQHASPINGDTHYLNDETTEYIHTDHLGSVVRDVPTTLATSANSATTHSASPAIQTGGS